MNEKRDILVKKFIDELTILKDNPEKYIQLNITNVLVLAYKIGISKIEFKDDERPIIGSLIKNVIKPIDDFIFDIGYMFEHNQASNNLIFRSGLQFMLDNFKSFPVSENETLEDTFKYFKETESVETLDTALVTWKHRNPKGDDDICYESDEITKPKDVPNSHTWWYAE